MIDLCGNKTTKKDGHEYWKARYQNNKAEMNAYSKIYEATHKKERKGYNLKRMYGLTLEKYNMIRLSQNDKCAICGKDNMILKIDHNHKTGKVRGLLCQTCNALTGYIETHGKLLTKVDKYLTTWNKENI